MTANKLLVIAALLAVSPPAWAQQASLDKCQKEVANQSAKFVTATTKAMAGCMQKISGSVIKKNDSIARAAKACASAFRKLENSEDPGKTVRAKATAKILGKCDPGVNAGLTHSATQVLQATPPLMVRGLEAKGLDAWCANFGGDGSLDSVGEWVNCALDAGLCQARQQLAVEYPRVLEWADGVQTEILALGAEAKFTDAANAVQDLKDALDRFSNDQLTINCGPGVSTCGDGVQNGTDDCDGSDLGGANCGTVGFLAGTLACKPDCHFDVSGCFTGAFPATGQTTSVQVGDDGDYEYGAPASFVDNGDGTLTDPRTGLMWEKKDRSGGIHDRGNTYSWTSTMNTVFLSTLNTMPCFANHCDWRVPNFHELSSIINYGAGNPAAYSSFNNSCVAACVVTTCSCTTSDPYYTSTTYSQDNSSVWLVDFTNGQVTFAPKGTARRVRAVRGGL